MINIQRFEIKFIAKWFFKVIDIKIGNIEPNAILNLMQRLANEYLWTKIMQLAGYNLYQVESSNKYSLNLLQGISFIIIEKRNISQSQLLKKVLIVIE